MFSYHGAASSHDDQPVRSLRGHPFSFRIPPDFSPSVVSKSIGCLLMGLIGDALGAPVEGWPPESIRSSHGFVERYYLGTHMGIRHLGPRRGMYTDDGNAALAVAAALVEKRRADAQAVAEKCASFYFCRECPERGAPLSAGRIMQRIVDGMPAEKTGSSEFPDGSYANGGAMRIGPVGVLYRAVDDDELFEAVRRTCLATHIHPEAVDGAYVIAKAVSFAMNCRVPSEFAIGRLFDEIVATVKTTEVRDLLVKTRMYVLTSSERIITESLLNPSVEEEELVFGWIDEDLAFLKATIETHEFQLKAKDAVTAVMLALGRYYRNPLLCMQIVIGYGGDTDTLACMLGFVLGALFGDTVIPDDWRFGLENGKRGRDYAVQLGTALGSMLPERLEVTPASGDDTMDVDDEL